MAPLEKLLDRIDEKFITGEISKEKYAQIKKKLKNKLNKDFNNPNTDDIFPSSDLSVFSGDDQNNPNFSYKQLLKSLISKDQPTSENNSDRKNSHQYQMNKYLDNYEIIDFLGEGSMDKVYKVLYHGLDKEVFRTIKFIPQSLTKDQRAFKKLKKEVRRSQKLQHTHIVGTYALDKVNNHYFIVREYIPGINFYGYLSNNKGDLDLEQVIELFSGVAEALDYAHELNKPIIHRNLNPRNLIFDKRDQRLKLTDFGLDREIQTFQTPNKSKLGGSVQSFRTKAYVPYEQFFGEEPIPEMDIYSLGIIIYEALNGSPPFVGKNIIFKHKDKKPPKIEHVPESVMEILYKALAKEPSKRYSSCIELIDALSEAAQGHKEKVNTSKINHLLKKGDELLNHNEFNKAKNLYREILEIAPNNTIAQKGLEKIKRMKKIYDNIGEAKNNLKNNNYQESLQNIQNVLSIDPQNEEAQKLQKKVREEKGKQEEQDKDRERIDTLISQGNSFLENKLFEQARNSFQEVLEIDSENKEAQEALDRLNKEQEIFNLFTKVGEYLEKETFEKAIKLLNQILEIDPENEEAKNVLLITNEKLRRKQEKQKKNTIEDLLSQGKSLIKNQQFDKARNKFKRILELDKNNIQAKKELRKVKHKEKIFQLYSQAKNLFHNNQYQPSIQVIKEILSIAPKYSQAQNLLEQAQKALKKKRQKQKNKKIENLLSEGKEDLENHNWRLAKEKFRKILKLDQNHNKAQKLLQKVEHERKISNLLKKAQNYFENNKFQPSIETLEKILSIKPKNKKANTLLKKVKEEKKLIDQKETEKRINRLLSHGKSLLSNKIFDQARKSFQEVLELDQDNEEAKLGIREVNKEEEVFNLFNQVSKFLNDKQYRAALKVLERILAIEPDNKEAENVLKNTRKKLKKVRKQKIRQLLKQGEYYSQKGVFNKARQKFNKVLELDKDNSQAKEALENIDSLVNLLQLIESINQDLEKTLIDNINSLNFNLNDFNLVQNLLSPRFLKNIDLAKVDLSYLLDKLNKLNIFSLPTSDLDFVKDKRDQILVGLDKLNFQELDGLNQNDNINSLHCNSQLIQSSSIGKELDNLEKLSCQNAEINDTSFLKNLDQLKKLNLSGTDIKDVKACYNLQNIEILKLNNTDIEYLEPLSELNNLKQLECNETSIHSLTSLKNIDTLQILKCQNTLINSIAPLINLTNLEILDISNTKVDDLTPLTENHGLKKLDITNTNINDLTPLYNLDKLHQIKCSGIKNAQLEKLNKKHSNCTILKFIIDENDEVKIEYFNGSNNN